MLPTNSEFILVYVAYLVMVLYLIYGFIFSKKKSFVKWNAVMFVLYFSFVAYLFLDPINFKGGASLVVLFYSALFITVHFAIIGLIKLLQFVIKK